MTEGGLGKPGLNRKYVFDVQTGFTDRGTGSFMEVKHLPNESYQIIVDRFSWRIIGNNRVALTFSERRTETYARTGTYTRNNRTFNRYGNPRTTTERLAREQTIGFSRDPNRGMPLLSFEGDPSIYRYTLFQ